MNKVSPADQGLVRRAVIEVASLPEEDLELVLQLAEQLKQRRNSATVEARKARAKAILAEAKRQAETLRNVPRSELVADIIRIADEIRAEAIANGTAIDGEIQGD